MGVRQLSLRDLAYVCAIAEYRHFGRAAEACAITQPALSERVRRMEEALGTVIFERTIAIVWRKTFPRGQDIESFAAFIADHLPGGLHSLVEKTVTTSMASGR